MTLYHALLLGLLQGVTEFLPISSSGHLALIEHYLGLPFSTHALQQFDIVLHAGSLLAILLYFLNTWLRVLRRPFAREPDGGPPLLLLLIVGTIPAAIAGYFGEAWIESLRSPLAIAIGFFITGGFLLASGYYESRFPGTAVVNGKQALGMGLGQMLALMPSVSRSGATIACGRFLGLSSERAAEFTFQLGMPALAGAVLLTALRSASDLLLIGWPPIIIGFSASFLASIVVMHVFIRTIQRYGVWMWAIYLLVIALLVAGDELLPVLQQVVATKELHLPLGAALGILFFALLLEAAPITSLFAPGFMTMVAFGFLYQGDWIRIAACVAVGTVALVAGNLLGYLPARQTRANVHWKEKADVRLHRAERFFLRWGVLAVIIGGWYGPTRSFISIAAGLGKMPMRKFLIAVLLGSALWTTAVLGGTALTHNALFSRL